MADEPRTVLVHEGPEHGYVGVVLDPTPNEFYTFAGQAGGAEQPAKVRRASKAAGTAES